MKKQYLCPLVKIVTLQAESNIMANSNQNIGIGDSYTAGSYEGDAAQRRGGWEEYEQ